MKRFLLLIGLLLCTLSVFAFESDQLQDIQSNDINLELSQPTKKINLPKSSYQSKVDYDKNVKNTEMQDYLKQNPNTKHSAKFDKKKKMKDITVGSSSTHTTTSDTYTNSNTLYTEYEKKNFKLNSSYTTTTKQNQQTQDKGTMSVAPEYKINKHVSIQNKYSTDLNNNSKKGEVNVKVKPFKDDRMDMGAGVGQKYSQSGSSSQLNFSTNIRW